ncbi:MAG: tetratricopeptide repeat protein [Chlorobi bacterium]|nr:tetratricopeptide repeat protein [Chlorobiota bacterium]
MPTPEREKYTDSLLHSQRLTPLQMGIVYNYKGVLARGANRFSDAVQYHKHAILYLEYTSDTLEYISALNNLAVALRKLNMENESFEYYMKAKTLAEKVHHPKSQAIALHGIANVFIDLGDYRRAIKYLHQSYAIEVKRGNIKGIEYNYANLAEAYIMLHQFDSAQYYLERMMELAHKLYGKSLGIELSLFGKYYFERQEYPKARYYYLQSLEDVTKHNYKRYIANGNIMVGRTYIQENRYRKARPYILTGLQIARDIGSRENIIMAYDALKDLYSRSGDYRKALNYLTIKERYKDSMINLRSLQSINSLEVLHKVKEKDSRIHQLYKEKLRAQKKSKWNRRVAIWTAVISLFIILLLWHMFALRRRNQELELERLNREIQQYVLQLEQLRQNEKDLDDKPVEEEKEKGGFLTDEEYVVSKLVKENQLTRRQAEILELILKGYSNKDISRELHISNNTVKTHIHHLYEKLNVKNRMEILQRIREKAPEVQRNDEKD